MFNGSVCMYVYILHVRMYNAHMSSCHGGQKKASSPLELELQAVVSCHMGAET